MTAANGKHYTPRPGFIPGTPVNLGGIEFVLAPLGIGPVRDYQDALQKMKELQTPREMEDAHYQNNVTLIHRSLLRNYPEIERDELETLLDTANMVEAINAILGLSGMKRVTPGELKASPSTGTTSMPS